MTATYQKSEIGKGLVYVKPVAVSDLPKRLADQAGELEEVFSVHDANGQQLALVASRDIAQDIAARHKLSAVALH